MAPLASTSSLSNGHSSTSTAMTSGTSVNLRLAEPYILLIGGPEHERARARRRRALRSQTNPTSTTTTSTANGTNGEGSTPPTGMVESPRNSRNNSPVASRRGGSGMGSNRGRSRGPSLSLPTGAGVGEGATGEFVRPSSRGRSTSRRPPSHASTSRTRNAESNNVPREAVLTLGTEDDDELRPAMLRGLLVLHLNRSTRIREISIRFRGLARTDWPEGIGPRRLDIMEESVLTNITSTFFSAKDSSMERRAASIGPGVAHDERYSNAGGRSRRAQSVRPVTSSIATTRDDMTIVDRGRTSTSSRSQLLQETGGESTRTAPMSTLSRIASSEDLDSSYHDDVPPILPGEQAPAYEAVPSLPSSPVVTASTSHHLINDDSIPLLEHRRRMTRSRNRLDRSPTPSRSPLGISQRASPPADSSSLDLPNTLTRSATNLTSRLSQESTNDVQPANDVPESPVNSSLDVSSASMSSDNDTLNGHHQSRRTGWNSAPVPGSTTSSFERGRSPTRPAYEDNDIDEEHTQSLGAVHRTSSGGPTYQSLASNRQSPSPAMSASTQRRSASISTRSLSRTISNTSMTTATGSTLPNTLRNLSTNRSSSRGGRFSLAGIGEALRGKSMQRTKDSSRTRRETSPDTRKAASTRDQSRGRKTALKVLRDALTSTSGMMHHDHGTYEGDNDQSDDDHHTFSTGWKEFKAGTYTYPISIPIPASLPPTISASFGHVTYSLKATVHRAGALTSNLTSSTEIVLVSAPSQDDTEENESIVVERFWETQMKYHVALSGKSFPIGSQIPISIRLNPMAKIKVYRITAVLEQKTNYYASGRKLTRHETPRKFPLLRIEHKDAKDALLPIFSDDQHALVDHPLAEFFINPTSSDDSTPALLDPLGPWNIESTLQLPTCASKLAFSTHHEQSNIATSHIIKVMLRVERGDDDFLDSKGKRKLWDVIIESPIHILACQCAQNSLPAYSPAGNFNPQSGVGSVLPCEIHSPSSSVLTNAPNSKPINSSTSLPNRSASHSRVRNAAQVAASAVVAAASPHVPHPYEPPAQIIDASELERTNALFARLVAGEQTPAGETPPAYWNAVSDLEGGQQLRGRVLLDGEDVDRGRTRTRDTSLES